MRGDSHPETGFSVVSIKMQHRRERSKFNRSLVRRISYTLVPIPYNGALAIAGVDKYISNLSSGAFDSFGKGNIDFLVPHRLQAENSLMIGTETSGVSCFHPQSLKSDHCARGLASRRLPVREQTSFCVERRIFRHEDQMINGIQAESGRIKTFMLR